MSKKNAAAVKNCCLRTDLPTHVLAIDQPLMLQPSLLSMCMRATPYIYKCALRVQLSCHQVRHGKLVTKNAAAVKNCCLRTDSPTHVLAIDQALLLPPSLLRLQHVHTACCLQGALYCARPLWPSQLGQAIQMIMWGGTHHVS
jgi:hypothetical protein